MCTGSWLLTIYTRACVMIWCIQMIVIIGTDTQNSGSVVTKGGTEANTTSLDVAVLHHLTHGRRILSIGDSLTKGAFISAHGDWGQHHSYILEFKRLINYEQVIIEQHGVSGEKLFGSMDRRLQDLLPPLDDLAIVIIWGGTNDLLKKPFADAVDILNAIIGMHRSVHEHGMLRQQYQNVYTVAVTIPPLITPTWAPDIMVNDTARKVINDGIHKYGRECGHLVAVQDFEGYFDSVFDKSVAENLKYWSSDEIHFSPLGYDKVGEILFNTILNFSHYLYRHTQIMNRNVKMKMC